MTSGNCCRLHASCAQSQARICVFGRAKSLLSFVGCRGLVFCFLSVAISVVCIELPISSAGR